jgi:hypothetical protein
VFPEHPRQVTTWAFSGFPPEKVLGVRVNQESFAVLFADSLSPEERDRIYQDLGERRVRATRFSDDCADRGMTGRSRRTIADLRSARERGTR